MQWLRKCSVLLAESENCLTMIVLSCFRNRLRPLRMVQCVRIVLGFESYTASLSIVNPIFTRLIQEITGVNLNTGTICMDGHGASGYRILKNGARITEYFPVVVIASLKMKRLVVLLNITQKGFWSAEIHRRTVNFPQFTGGDIFSIIGAEEPTWQNQNLLHCIICLFVTCQVEIAVICHIEDRILIAYSIILNVQASFIVQFISYLYDGIARETLITIRTIELECYRSRRELNRLPEAQMEIIRTTVKVICAVVLRECVRSAFVVELRTLKTIGISANGGTEAGTIRDSVSVAVIVTQHNVSRIAGSIRNQESDKRCSVICDRCGDTSIGYGV